MTPARRTPITDPAREPNAATNVSGERPSVQSRGRARADLELTCVTAEKLAKLYDSNLKRRIMMLPVDTTQKRGTASICINLPSGERIWLRAQIADVTTAPGQAIRVSFEALTDVQTKRIEDALGRPRGIR